MTLRPHRQSSRDAFGHFLGTITEAIHRGQREPARVVRLVRAGTDLVVTLTGAPNNGTPAVIGSFVAPGGRWMLDIDWRGDYDAIACSLSEVAPSVGWSLWSGARPTSAADIGGHAQQEAAYIEPTAVDVGAMVDEAVAGDVIVTIRFSPLEG